MAHRFEKETKALIIDGFQDGISDSPYEGFTDMRNADIISEKGEISVAFSSGAVTLPPIFDAVAYTSTASTDRLSTASVTGIYDRCAIFLTSNTSTGLSDATVYYVRNISGTTFQLSRYPNSAVVNFTTDGTGTFTTYQYGNQRGLEDNGAPVSYFAAPEIEGVLLIDSSNYAWLWQQGSNGETPFNTLLFLGNTGASGIAATTSNQTGIAYWNGYVVILQQTNTINLLLWSSFITLDGGQWNYSSIRGSEIMSDVALSSAASYRYQEVELRSTDGTPVQLLDSDRVDSTASSATIVSNSITIEQTGELLYVAVATYNATSVTAVDFNGTAMTLLTAGSGAAPFNYGRAIYYLVNPTVSTGVITATYAAAVTDRVLVAARFRNATTGSNGSGSASAVSSFTPSSSIDITSPEDALLVFLLTNGNITFSPVSPTVNLEYGVTNVYANGCLFMKPQFGVSNTLKGNVPITVGDNNTLYWGSGENNIGSLNQNAGETFDPTNTDTYTIAWSALDLPKSETVQSLQQSSGSLFVGTGSKKVYSWDTISPSFDTPISFPEPAVVDFVGTNNLLYSFAGNQGRIYLTNNSSAELYREIPGSISGTDRPFFFFWDANVGNNELYFSVQAFLNSDPSIGAPLNTTAGAWAINSDTGAFRMVQSTINTPAWIRMVLPVSDGFSQEMLRPPGQGLLLGYSDGENYFLDFSISEPYTEYSTLAESEIIEVGTYFSQNTFQHIEYKLSVPMVAGEGIRISQRSNLNSAYTQIAEFTTPGLISDQSSINWQNVQWFQLKIEAKSVAVSPSYVRIRNISLH